MQLGHVPGKLMLADRTGAMQRPGVTSKEEGEAPPPSLAGSTAENRPNTRPLEKAHIGVATREYALSLEPPLTGAKSRSMSGGAAYRQFVEESAKNLTSRLDRSLTYPTLAATNGLVYCELTVLVALRIDEQASKPIPKS